MEGYPVCPAWLDCDDEAAPACFNGCVDDCDCVKNCVCVTSCWVLALFPGGGVAIGGGVPKDLVVVLELVAEPVVAPVVVAQVVVVVP
eukprot:11799757-Karenia_brevis.AAC.1